MNRIRPIAAALCVTLLGACSSWSWPPRIVTEYRIDVQQGNALTQEQVSQLRPGLTRDQVRYLLGTPLLVDVFHNDRWDYVYRLKKGATGAIEDRRLTIFFDAEGKLARLTGDVVAAKSGDAQAPEPKSRVIDLGSVPAGAKAQAPQEKGFFGRMLEKIGL